MGTRPTCTDLEPILRDTFVDTDAVWDVVVAHRDFIESVVAKIHRTQRRAMDAADLTQETLLNLVEKVTGHRGLTRPGDCDGRDPGAWFGAVIGNQARDRLRGRPDRRVRDGSTPFRTSADGEDLSSHDLNLAVHTDPVLALDTKREREREIAAYEAIDMPAPYRLAWMLQHRPDLLDWSDPAPPAPVVAACAHEHGKDSGLARPAGETWALLVAWHADHGERPTTPDSRRALAWILRSDDDSGPARWRERDPDGMSRARDVVRKWGARGKQKVDAARGTAR